MAPETSPGYVTGIVLNAMSQSLKLMNNYRSELYLSIGPTFGGLRDQLVRRILTYFNIYRAKNIKFKRSKKLPHVKPLTPLYLILWNNVYSFPNQYKFTHTTNY